jgi:periplasmic divalent cation tolerance protein
MEEGLVDDASRLRVVLVTVPDADAGCVLARRVVGEHLAACGNVIPGLTSVYRWDGKVQEEPEALVLFKTTEGSLAELEKRIMELHPYDVPEFLALPVTEGHGPYLRWVVRESMKPGTSE